MVEIKKDMLISDVVQKYPKTAQIMMNSGLHCIGCMMGAMETIEQGSAAHGMSSEDIDKMVEEMNKVIEEKDDKQK